LYGKKKVHTKKRVREIRQSDGKLVCIVTSSFVASSIGMSVFHSSNLHFSVAKNFTAAQQKAASAFHVTNSILPHQLVVMKVRGIKSGNEGVHLVQQVLRARSKLQFIK
jgi:hypothetical protein